MAWLADFSCFLRKQISFEEPSAIYGLGGVTLIYGCDGFGCHHASWLHYPAPFGISLH